MDYPTRLYLQKIKKAGLTCLFCPKITIWFIYMRKYKIRKDVFI